MAHPSADGRPLLEWSVAAAPKEGETESGDRYLVLDEKGGVLVAVVDGLGHGAPAAAASQLAVDVLTRNHHRASIPALVQRCHESLVETRGAVMSLARFTARDGIVKWLGVGNVDGRLIRNGGEHVDLLVRSGIVGVSLPELRVATTKVGTGDLFLITTDGIDPSHIQLLGTETNPAHLAGQILATCGTGADDALVLVARYRSWDPASAR